MQCPIFLSHEACASPWDGESRIDRERSNLDQREELL